MAHIKGSRSPDKETTCFAILQPEARDKILVLEYLKKLINEKNQF